MDILYQDRDLLLCIKPVGLDSEKEVCALLSEQLELPQVYCLHRLDTAVGGVMVYGKTKTAAARMSRLIEEKAMEKQYLAIVSGCPEQEKGTFSDLLFKDSRKNKSFIVERERRGVKRAVLDYEVLAKEGGRSLVKVTLRTGRSHQIRVQFAGRRMPLLGDGKYGSREKGNIALWSYRLSFTGPISGKSIDISALPPMEAPWTYFEEYYEKLPSCPQL